MAMKQLSLFMVLCLGVQELGSELLQRQKRSWIIDSYTIDEGYKGPFPYSLGTVKIEKSLTLFKIHGQGVDVEPKGILAIDKDTGEITVHGPLDFEKFPVLKLTFQAVDAVNEIVDTQLGMEIIVIDSNDNSPKFDSEMYKISIKESTAQGTELITFRASDQDSGKNGKFGFKIVSVSPTPQGMEFILTEMTSTQTGTISFHGCLDHTKAKKYSIIVEAKDTGDKVKLSSSCTIIIDIEDGNNHLPRITGQTGPGKVKEGDEDVLVSRLQVTDQDSKGTAAWRAKYQIRGDTNNNFKITTDPETNEGLLYVEKYLDYEETHLKNLTISVENEIPMHSCKVVSQRATGLWEVVTTSGATWTETLAVSTLHVTVAVEDVNEPPIFDKPNQHIVLSEGVQVGHYLMTFEARDPDIGSANSFVYIKGEDPADWVTVDHTTGKITTIKTMDRESSYVKDNNYYVTIYAVDDGNPPLTSTATLNIHISDENDNAPSLAVSSIVICQSNGPSLANITALDLDEGVYGGPFRFMLMGDVEGKWSLDSEQGYMVNLVKDNTVHAGQFEFQLKVSDRQEKSAVHNLSITVCSCLNPSMPDCHSLKTAAIGVAALGIIFFSILLLAGMLLLACMVTRRPEFVRMPGVADVAEQILIKSNTEKPGDDCKVVFVAPDPGYSQVQIKTGKTVSLTKIIKTTEQGTSKTDNQDQQRNCWHGSITDSASDAARARSVYSGFMGQESTRWSFMRSSMGASSNMRTRNHHKNSKAMSELKGHSQFSADQASGTSHQFLLKVLQKMLYKLEAPGEELGDYAPHVYAVEGDAHNSTDLDAIYVSEIPFDPDMDLDFHFYKLASICMPSEISAKTNQMCNGNACNSYSHPIGKPDEGKYEHSTHYIKKSKICFDISHQVINPKL